LAGALDQSAFSSWLEPHIVTIGSPAPYPDPERAWTVHRGVRAQEAAGVIHSDLEKHFIRAETIRWDELLDAGSEANARSKGTLRLEGKDYIVQDGDVMHIRHSG